MRRVKSAPASLCSMCHRLRGSATERPATPPLGEATEATEATDLDPSEMADKISKRPRTAEHDDGSYAVGSAEGAELRWTHRAALCAGAVKDWIDETGGVGTFPTPLPTKALSTLLAACEHDNGAATSPIASLSTDETSDLLHAAHFLGQLLYLYAEESR